MTEGLIPPQSLEAEQAVLGAMLIDRSAIDTAADILKPDDFYREAHGVIFEAVLSLVSRREPVDLLTVRDQLVKMDVLENIGGATYLIQLTHAVPSATNAEYYAKLVAERATRRRIIDAANQQIALAHDLDREIEIVTGDCGKTLEDAVSRSVTRDYRRMCEIVPLVFDELEAAAENPGKMTGIPTGFPDLDWATNGWQKGDMVIVAARPGVGKTAVSVNTFAMAAEEAGRRVAVFSLEMRNEQVVKRMMAADAKVSLTQMRNGTLASDEWQRLGEVSAELNDSTMLMDDAANLTPTQIRNKLRRMNRREGTVDLVVVDYLALMNLDEGGKERDWRSVDAAARAMKNMAKEFGMPVILLTQLNKDIDRRGAGRPVLADVKEAGEAHADIVAFLWLDKDQPNEDKRKVWFSVAKHRNGPQCDIPLTYHPSWTRFEQVEDDKYSAGVPMKVRQYVEDDDAVIQPTSTAASDHIQGFFSGVTNNGAKAVVADPFG